jgi:GNAT superfamily N-acetyltransferase
MCIKDFKSMDVDHSNSEDFDGWLSLAMEVEPLFGPMAHERAFQEALRQAISENRAFCIRSDQSKKEDRLKGGIIISRESNEIAWFAVSKKYRGMGFGKQLLEFAIGQLNPQESIVVETFDASVPEGKAARKLYMD